MDLTNNPAPKRQLLPMIGIGITFVLAGVAMATALRLYQLRAPNAPESQPEAQSSLTTNTTNPLFETASCTALSFTIGTSTPTPTGTATATPTATPTDSPTPTGTATATPTSTATATPTSTATSTPQVTTSTPTATPTELPAAGVSIPTIFVMAAGLILLTMAALLII